MGTSIFGRIPSVTKNLLIINIIVFSFGALIQDAIPRMEDFLALHYATSPGFRIWQIFTYMFMHANVTHLFFNMFALFMFGSILEWTMGWKRFLFFYISCGIGADGRVRHNIVQVPGHDGPVSVPRCNCIRLECHAPRDVLH